MKKIVLVISLLALIAVEMPYCFSSPENIFELRKQVKGIQDNMLSTGDFDSAFEKLQEINKEHSDKYELMIAMGIAEYGRMNYSKAEQYFQQAMDSGVKGRVRDMLKSMLDMLEENEGVLSSIEAFKQMPLNDENTAKLNAAHIVVLNSVMDEGYYYAFTIIPHLIWLRDNYAELDNIYEILGEVYYSSYYYGEAAKNYLIALKNDPKNAEICQNLADAYVGAGDFDSARKYYDVLIKIYGDEGSAGNEGLIRRIKSIKQALPESYKDIGELIVDKKFIKAEQLAKERISLNPGDYVAITQLGRIYWDKGEKRKAIKLFRKVIRMAPDYPTAHLFLGKAYFFERKPEKGIREFEVFKEKMELVPEMDEETSDTYVKNLHYICYIYYTQKRYAEAMEECRKILEMRPEDQRAHYNLAVSYYIYKNNRSKAYNELQTVLEIDGSTKIADKARYYIDYIRRNPDARVIGDFSFLYEE